jgi:hypothetical protein
VLLLVLRQHWWCFRHQACNGPGPLVMVTPMQLQQLLCFSCLLYSFWVAAA